MGSEETKVETLTEEVARLRKRVTELESALADTPGMSRDTFKRMVEATGTAFFVISGDRTIFANRVCEEITEYTNEELLNMPFVELVHPDSRELIMERYAARQAGGREEPSSFELKILTKSGQVRWLEAGGGYAELEDGPAVFAVAKDATELKEAREALRQSEAMFRTLCEKTPVAVFIHRGGTMVYANPAAAEVSGYSVEELGQMDFFQVVHPDHREMVRQRGLQRLEGLTPPSPYEIKILTRQGEVRRLGNSVVGSHERGGGSRRISGPIGQRT